MKVYRTAGITAVWRYMSNVDNHAISYVNFPLRVLGYILGILDPNSVETIAQRTKLIDEFIKKLKPKYIVEIGAGFSSRAKRFDNIKCYELDLPYFTKKKNNITSFEIGKDNLNLDIKNALFIVEGVTMYLQKWQVIDLLKQIKQYKGYLLIDFLDKEFSTKKKNIRERIYKFLFKLIIDRNYLFDYRIEDVKEGISLLKSLGYKNVRYYNYDVSKSLDVLFYGELE